MSERTVCGVSGRAEGWYELAFLTTRGDGTCPRRLIKDGRWMVDDKCKHGYETLPLNNYNMLAAQPSYSTPDTQTGTRHQRRKKVAVVGRKRRRGRRRTGKGEMGQEMKDSDGEYNVNGINEYHRLRRRVLPYDPSPLRPFS